VTPVETRRQAKLISAVAKEIDMNADEAKTRAFTALDNLAAELETSSKPLETFLHAMAKFHRYSFWNTMLIAMTRPDATRVAGFKTWQTLGRHVKQGEKAIQIFAPVLHKQKKGDATEEQLLGFTIAYVFDVSQTDGTPLPPFATVRGDPGRALERLHGYAAQLGIKVIVTPMKMTASGMSAGGRIVLREGLEPADEFATLAHELAHELLHDAEQRATLPKSVMELEAESVAYVVCSAVALDTNTAFSDYLKLYRGDSKLLRASLDRIQKTASPILTAILGGAQ
jgi:hypothetical protein